MAKRTFTKYPSGYVKADTEVSDNAIVDIYICEGVIPDTFYVEAQTQSDVITISAKNNWSGRYEPTYILKSEENGIISEGTWRSVVSTFFNSYDVSQNFRRKITMFASNY